MMKLNRLEFWIATAASVLTIFMNIPVGYQPTQEYMNEYVFPILLTVSGTYSAFLILANVILDRNLPERNWDKIGWQSLALMAGLLVVFTASAQLKQPESAIFQSMLGQASFTFAVACTLAIYMLIKHYLTSLQVNRQIHKHKMVVEILAIATTWSAVLVLLMATNNEHFGPIWISAIPFGFLIYIINRYWLLPAYPSDPFFNSGFWIRLTAFAVASWVFFFLVRQSLGSGISTAGYVTGTIMLFFCSLSVAWFSFQQSLKAHQVQALRTELGRSSADLQLLRSQINPHFLFNILNTLYGTAIQESAGRTSEGIQRLGDMMRFMLHENTLEFIPIVREIDYLKDYIHLQSLRIAHSPQITIQVYITEEPCHQMIAPMLLIPFVENAFKHGISLQNPSRITITLHCEDNRIDFDVHNSVHRRPQNDTEKFHGGIGLENVKQRLALLYPQKHELMIRESKTEYFVHLKLFV